MRKIFIPLLAFLTALTMQAGDARASANFAHDTVTYKAGVARTVPRCTANEVLSHNGQMLVCMPNFPTDACPPGWVIRNIRPDGSVDCTTAQYPNGLACPNPDDAIVSINTTTTPPTVNCTRVRFTPPACGNLETLTSRAGGLNCVRATRGIAVHINDLTPWNGFCTAGTIMPATGEYGGNIFSAWCISACHRWCANLSDYDGGVITRWNSATQLATCACSK